MTVYCDNENCLYFREEECACGHLNISRGECRSKQNYMDLPEYQNPYWSEFGDKGRYLQKGKIIKIKGRQFFTKDNDRFFPDKILLTDARSGCLVGTPQGLKKHWKEFLDYEASLPDVTTLPIYEET